MSLLQQKIADKKALAAQDAVEDCNDDTQEEPQVDPAPTIEPTPADLTPDYPDTPLEILLIPGVPISTPEEEINRHGILSNTEGSFIDPLHSHFAPTMPSSITPNGSVMDNVYLALDRSRKGYQWSKGIIRPNVFGQYIPRTKEESAFLTALETSGILEKNPNPQKY